MPNDSGRLPSKPADIINLSLGSSSSCSAEEAALFSEVASRGIAVVAAAGNTHSNVDSSPADCPDVFAVAATGPGHDLAPYSNFGPLANIAAPGGDMQSDADRDGFPDGVFSASGQLVNGTTVSSYTSLEGTSMAAPHVAGVFALMKSIKPTLTPLELHQLLEGGWLTDQDLSRSWPNELGYGVIDAYKAVRAASDNFTPPPRVASSPGALDLDAIDSSATFKLRNTGIGALSVTDIRSAASWLNVATVNVDANGLGSYLASVNWQTMPRGTQRTTIEIQSTAGPAHIPVSFTKLAGNVGSYIGALYVRVSDAKTGQIVRNLILKQPNLQASYRFDDLPLGTYVVTVGTDYNNDGNLCDPGEICGAYPIRSLPEAIEYNGVAVDINVELSVTAIEP